MNNASHSVDMALQFMGDVDAQGEDRRAPHYLCAGDADDHVKIVLTAPGAPAGGHRGHQRHRGGR